MSEPTSTNKPWLERGSSTTLLYRLLLALCLLLLVPDVLDLLHVGYHKHLHYSAEGWFAFYAAFGFIAYSFIVGAGWVWRRVVMRDEDYYERGEGDG